jgi:hypothetical protein
MSPAGLTPTLTDVLDFFVTTVPSASLYVLDDDEVSHFFSMGFVWLAPTAAPAITPA